MAKGDGGAGFDTCTEVSEFCPVAATTLGYYPNLGANIFFAIVFGILLVAALGLGIWKRTWTYGAAITVGLLMEVCGYVGRVLLHDNPWDKNAFQMEICTIILAPTFICISIYLTLKHVALALNPRLSRFNPRWFPWIFLPGDLSCLIVQAIGGGLAAAAGPGDKKLLDGGNNAIIAGIVLQVVVLAIFGVLGLDYFIRVRKHMRGPDVDPSAMAVWMDSKFRMFAFAVTGAYAAILIRCIYRIIEMAGGWGNHIMQDEPSFMILDTTMVVIATFLLTAFHPGLFFPQMSNGYRRDQAKAKGNDSSSAEVSEGPVVTETKP